MVATLLILIACVSIRGNSLSTICNIITGLSVLECLPLDSLEPDIPVLSPDDLIETLARLDDDYDESLRVKKDEKWKMRMFKRDDENYEEDQDETFMDKRSQPWKMRMFKKSHPWSMKMYKRYPLYFRSELAKKSPWKMRMFKRFGNSWGSMGKRPDKWQMRMFKRG